MSEITEKKILTKKDLIKAWLIWENLPQTCYNYERMHGQAVAHSFVPIAKKLYKENSEGKKEMMKRESEFFNVHVEFGSVIIGVAIALEEQIAKGIAIPKEFITSIKTSLMGPLSGVGDTIYQGVLIPILLAICIDFTLKSQTIWGAIIYAVAMIAISFIFSYYNFMFGYRAGTESILEFLEKGILNKILRGAEIMGCFVMGGLISNYVDMKVPLTLTTANSDFSIQKQFLDVLMPNIVPFGFTLLVYYLMSKRGWTSIKMIGLIVVIGIVCGYFGILGK